MKRLSVVALAVVFLTMRQTGWAQTATLIPNQIPNSIAPSQGEAFHQRIELTLGETAGEASRAFTITASPQVSVVVNSVTAISSAADVSAFFSGTPTGFDSSPVRLAFGVTNTSTGQVSVATRTITIEFDVTTPTNFDGIPNGGKVDTIYSIVFSTTANQTSFSLPVAKHQNRRVQALSFVTPDSVQGDTAGGGGRFFKLEFPGSLPDLSHTGLSGLSQQPVSTTDGRTDVVYSFYLFQDANVIRTREPNEAVFFSLMDAPPVIGSW